MNSIIDNMLINHNTSNIYGVYNSAYFSTKYIKVSPYNSLTFVLNGGEVMLYRKDFVYAAYWARVSVPKSGAGNVYVKNNTTGEYLYKGEDV